MLKATTTRLQRKIKLNREANIGNAARGSEARKRLARTYKTMRLRFPSSHPMRTL